MVCALGQRMTIPLIIDTGLSGSHSLGHLILLLYLGCLQSSVPLHGMLLASSDKVNHFHCIVHCIYVCMCSCR